MYDWANSAYATTVLAGLLPYYFVRVVVGPEGARIGGSVYSGFALWGFVAAAAAFLVFLAGPLLGAIADFSASKKRFLLAFAYTGSLFTLLLYLSRSGDVTKTMFIFLMAQIGFVGANIFYDAFLPQIASPDQMDWVSGKGFSYGYVGGGIQFALSLGLVAAHEKLCISQELAARLAIAMAGVWLAGFTLFAARYISEPPATETLPARYARTPRLLAYGMVGVTRLFGTLRRVGQFRHLVLFLIAFMLYNDGIQTVIQMATAYGTEELELKAVHLMLALLLIQAVATFGALFFGRLAGRIGAKRTVMITLVLWSGIVVYAYFIQTATEYFILGGAVGIVMGGSQALSRSFYGSMIPEGATAEFYGFYSVFSKFSAIWGPLAMGVIRQVTGSARLSIVALVVFFVAGLILLSFVDENKARQAKLSPAF